MKNQPLNLFIVDDDTTIVNGLRNYLHKKFGNNVAISSYSSGKSALQKIDKNTNIVVLDYNLKGENGNDVLKSIKLINPKTEVIMLTSNEDISVAIESFREGASDYVIKGEKAAWTTVYSLILNIITYPAKFLVKEFGVNKYLAMFLTTFLVMAIGVYVVLQFI